MNGSEQERRLMEVLRGLGFVPIRSPGSGTGDWEQPDVLAAQQGIAVAVELKSGSNPRNLAEDEVDALERFADAFWAAAMVGVRFKGDRTFYLAEADRLTRTDSGRYSIPNSPKRLPWAVALPYSVGDGGASPDDPLFATDEVPPGLADWLDALSARQQGFQVRRGVVDLNGPPGHQRAADGADGDADMGDADKPGDDDA